MQTSAPRTMRSRRTGTRHGVFEVQPPPSRHDDHVLRVAVRDRPDRGGAAAAGSLPGGFAAFHLRLAAIHGLDAGGDRAHGVAPGRGSAVDDVRHQAHGLAREGGGRGEEQTSEFHTLMSIYYTVFGLKQNKYNYTVVKQHL